MIASDRHDARLGMAWWNRLTRQERAEWLARANSAVPADAWAAFKAAAARGKHEPEALPVEAVPGAGPAF